MIKNFEGFKFKEVERCKTDQVWLWLLYEGGDADTRHPEEISLGIRYSEIDEHADEIKEIIEKYKRLKKVLDCGSYGGRIRSRRINGEYRNVISNRGGRPDVEIEDDLQDLVDNAPNDPQNDFQDKCYLSSMKLIAYDIEGNKHEAYI